MPETLNLAAKPSRTAEPSRTANSRSTERPKKSDWSNVAKPRDARGSAGGAPARGTTRPSNQNANGGRRSAARQALISRLDRLRVQPIEYMPNASFDDPSVWNELEQPLPAAAADERFPAHGAPTSGAYLGRLGDAALLKPAEEATLFRRLNLLKHCAATLLARLDEANVEESRLARVETLLAEACAVRNRILQANLRLVVSVAKNFADAENPLHELISDGNMSLLRAIEKFDFARGFRFSTYATWALRKNYQRSLWRRHRERGRLLLVEDEIHNAVAPVVEEESSSGIRLERLRSLIADVLGRLEPREQSIVAARFGLACDGQTQTLSQLGVALGISKERVRQLESRALDKLRALAAPLAATI